MWKMLYIKQIILVFKSEVSGGMRDLSIMQYCPYVLPVNSFAVKKFKVNHFYFNLWKKVFVIFTI